MHRVAAMHIKILSMHLGIPNTSLNAHIRNRNRREVAAPMASRRNILCPVFFSILTNIHSNMHEWFSLLKLLGKPLLALIYAVELFGSGAAKLHT